MVSQRAKWYHNQPLKFRLSADGRVIRRTTANPPTSTANPALLSRQATTRSATTMGGKKSKVKSPAKAAAKPQSTPTAPSPQAVAHTSPAAPKQTLKQPVQNEAPIQRPASPQETTASQAKAAASPTDSWSHVMADQAEGMLILPPGHTGFTWLCADGSDVTPPLGHTRFSWGVKA